MNAQSQFHRMIRRDFLLDGGADVLGLIRALVESCDNGDADREAAALEAHQADRAAWWTLSDHTNQAALLVCQYANTHGLGFALRLGADEHWPSAARHPAFLVAMMVPLNRPAREEYSRMAMRIAAGVQ